MSWQNRNDKVQLLFNPTTKLFPRFERKINSAAACKGRRWGVRTALGEGGEGVPRGQKTSGLPGPVGESWANGR